MHTKKLYQRQFVVERENPLDKINCLTHQKSAEMMQINVGNKVLLFQPKTVVHPTCVIQNPTKLSKNYFARKRRLKSFKMVRFSDLKPLPDSFYSNTEDQDFNGRENNPHSDLGIKVK